MQTPRQDQFWGNSYGSLYRPDRLIEFFPTANMSFEERLNAITRLSVYLGLVLFLYTTRRWTLYIPMVGHAVAILIYRSRYPDGGAAPAVTTDRDSFRYNEHYNADGETKTLKREGCTAPTRNNPFMNVMMDEWTGDPTRPQACAADREIKDNIEDHFNYNLYKDVNDVFNKNNGQRQFMTMPYTTIPNDQTNFAKWLYAVPTTCKEDSTNCLRREDVRQGSRGTLDYEDNPINYEITR